MVVLPEDVSIVTTLRNQFNAWRRNNNKQGEEMKYDNTFLLLLGTKPRVTAISIPKCHINIEYTDGGVNVLLFRKEKK